jgi:hypothetical protein
MIDSTWGNLGRTSAWVFGGVAIVAGALVTVVSIGIPPTEPDLVKHYDYVRAIWPELYISFVLFMVMFLSLVPLGLVLRGLFKDDVRGDLVHASFLAAAIVGVLWMLVQVGSAQAIVRDTAGVSPADLKVIGASSSIWSGVINWLQRGFLLFASLGTYWTGRIALKQRLLPGGLARLSIALAGFYWLGLASLLLRDLGIPVPDAVGSLLIGVGLLLALVWAGWLGWELHPARKPA